MSAGWTDERIEQLKALWNEGLSASQVARVLGGVTRNAVIGKVHRLGLTLRGTHAPRKTTTYPAIRHRPTFAEPEPPAPVLEPDAVVPHVTIATVIAGQCRWPHGDPQQTDFHLCGNPSVTGSPYCAAHSRKAYAVGHQRPREDKATEELAVIARAERIFA